MIFLSYQIFTVVKNSNIFHKSQHTYCKSTSHKDILHLLLEAFKNKLHTDMAQLFILFLWRKLVLPGPLLEC